MPPEFSQYTLTSAPPKLPLTVILKSRILIPTGNVVTLSLFKTFLDLLFSSQASNGTQKKTGVLSPYISFFVISALVHFP